MKNRFLLIVEGEKTEPTIFEQVLERYGYNVISCKQKLDVDDEFVFSELQYANEKNNVVIIQGPRNRIHDFLANYRVNEYSFEKMFSNSSDLFQGIFLIYDVDHNDNHDLEDMYNKFNDESNGLLLISSPCIEVLADYNRNRKEEKYQHISEYKKDLNLYYEKNKMTVVDYIVNNFESLCLYYLSKNRNDFDENNIMEHPRLVIDKINNDNERINYSGDERYKSYVVYRYYTTVVYVFIAFIEGLTRKIDNYNDVKAWFENKILN